MISSISLIAYIIFSMFVFYQQLHGKNFSGSSQSFATALHIFAFAGMLVGLAFLVFCFVNFSWWTPVVVFLIGLIAKFPMFLIERIVSKFVLSLAGFVVWPISSFVMFYFA